MREDRRPGTSRWRRSTCGCGAHGHNADEHAFHPKWWSSSPTLGSSRRLTTVPYDDERGSRSTTCSESGRRSPLVPVSSVTSHASDSGGACAASDGEG